MSIQRNTKAALAATLMGSLLLVACGGDSSSDNAANPTSVPATATPTTAPTVAPTVAPTAEPTAAPTAEPTVAPTAEPTAAPTAVPGATAVLDEAFTGAASDTLFTVAFKTLPSDATKPMYVATAGSPTVADGVVTLANSRFTIGAVAGDDGKVAPSTADSAPVGVLDLSKAFKVTIKVTEAATTIAGKDNFFVYVNNSTTGSATAPTSRSAYVKTPISSVIVGDNVFLFNAVDKASFLQIRSESGASVKIDSIKIEYQ